MSARTLNGLASVALISLALGCERGTPASAVLAAKPTGLSPDFSASANNHHMRWDIVSVNFATLTLSAGGVASARANDGSKITLTGSGTYRSNPGNPQDVTGGGTWQTFEASGGSTGSGSYTVTGLVSFILAPGTFPLQHDNIGDPNGADVRAGLLVVRIAYSDGSEGTLVVSCHIVGTPDAVFEGVTASKGFVDYWNREAPPAPPGNANRTAFHVID
ncbi:MAG: hypothetical protein AUG85_00890 [Gemmatimonadetes bacterium 13_1_20CM_4_66_11]|nr:MAG: hypothetical protein AUG85_00890 [Gemmatimonadetes bacterium 13_1_20CM_4_66_11]